MTYLRLLIPLIVALGYGIYVFVSYVLKQKMYKKYISMPAPYSGQEAAAIIMQRAGCTKSRFNISKKNTRNPFAGNAYLPDMDMFVMNRELAHSKTVLSMHAGCQLAESAIRYADGDLCKDRACEMNGYYALKYVVDREELEEFAEKVNFKAAKSAEIT